MARIAKRQKTWLARSYRLGPLFREPRSVDQPRVLVVSSIAVVGSAHPRQHDTMKRDASASRRHERRPSALDEGAGRQRGQDQEQRYIITASHRGDSLVRPKFAARQTDFRSPQAPRFSIHRPFWRTSKGAAVGASRRKTSTQPTERASQPRSALISHAAPITAPRRRVATPRAAPLDGPSCSVDKGGRPQCWPRSRRCAQGADDGDARPRRQDCRHARRLARRCALILFFNRRGRPHAHAVALLTSTVLSFSAQAPFRSPRQSSCPTTAATSRGR